MLKSTFCYGVEKAVNLVLAKDPQSQSRLVALEDKSISIEISDFSLTMYWIFEQQHIRVVTDWRNDVDASIKGPLEAIAKLGLSKAKVAKDLTISGDLHVVEAFKELFAKLDIDWQADLAVITGDAAAYKIGQTLKQAGQFFKQAGKSFANNSKEYIEHEAELLPSRFQFEDFSQDVRELNRDMDRIAAKINRLQQMAHL